MPELPDIAAYLQALNKFIGGQTIDRVQIKSPFVVRTFEPGLDECVGRKVSGFDRLGKRIVWCLEGELYVVFHLMIAGRFHWKSKPVSPRSKNDLVAFTFGECTLMMTEASPKKRASIHVVDSRDGVETFRPPGIEIDSMTFEAFCDQLEIQNHTLKRSLTDPKLFSGIGNA